MKADLLSPSIAIHKASCLTINILVDSYSSTTSKKLKKLRPTQRDIPVEVCVILRYSHGAEKTVCLEKLSNYERILMELNPGIVSFDLITDVADLRASGKDQYYHLYIRIENISIESGQCTGTFVV